jgi:hypothetical protein
MKLILVVSDRAAGLLTERLAQEPVESVPAFPLGN